MSAPKRHWASHLRLSHRGAAFLAREEGVRTSPYRDSRGLVTTGVGHLITPAHQTITTEDRVKWTFPSERAAIDYFRLHDAPVYERAVHMALRNASLTQAQFDMLVSLCFNIGAAGFASSQVARYVRAGQMRRAGLAFFGWAHPKELWGRRARESARFLIGRW